MIRIARTPSALGQVQCQSQAFRMARRDCDFDPHMTSDDWIYRLTRLRIFSRLGRERDDQALWWPDRVMTPSEAASPFDLLLPVHPFHTMAMSDVRPFDAITLQRVNLVAEFLSEYHDPAKIDTPSCAFILAGSAILRVATATFDYLSRWATPTTLVIAGGKGHSTQLLYDAVASHPRYRVIASEVEGLPEARVLERILEVFWPELWSRAQSGSLTLLVEAESRNCGENAEAALLMLRQHGLEPRSITVVQEPTMSRRTAASVRKHLDDRAGASDDHEALNVLVKAWPTFVPDLAYQDGKFAWSAETLHISRELDSEPGAGLWTQQRFIDLILGEIPRLRDDADGYGPRGKNFIPHVDIPPEVIEAYEQLRNTFVTTR